MMKSRPVTSFAIAAAITVFAILAPFMVARNTNTHTDTQTAQLVAEIRRAQRENRLLLCGLATQAKLSTLGLCP